MANPSSKKNHKGGTKWPVVFASRAADGKATGASNKSGTKSLITQMYESDIKDAGLKVASESEREIKAKTQSGGKKVQGSSTKSGQKTYKAGAKAGGSMKIDMGKNDGKQKYLSVVVPAGATVSDMVAFAQKFKNKPKFIITPSGERHIISVNIKV